MQSLLTTGGLHQRLLFIVGWFVEKMTVCLLDGFILWRFWVCPPSFWVTAWTLCAHDVSVLFDGWWAAPGRAAVPAPLGGTCPLAAGGSSWPDSRALWIPVCCCLDLPLPTSTLAKVCIPQSCDNTQKELSAYQ